LVGDESERKLNKWDQLAFAVQRAKPSSESGKKGNMNIQVFIEAKFYF
jgi:hypothetical protein